MSFFQTVGAVLWSFTGLRRNSDSQKDVERINPVYLVIAGVVLAACLVLLLLFIVRMVVG